MAVAECGIHRRAFISGAVSLLGAPSIVRFSSLMPVRRLPFEKHYFERQYYVFEHGDYETNFRLIHSGSGFLDLSHIEPSPVTDLFRLFGA